MSTKAKDKPGFKVEGPYSFELLDHMFPQSPQCAHDSVEKLLEKRASEGWDIVSASVSAGAWNFVFKASA